jgi:hypothetical protein
MEEIKKRPNQRQMLGQSCKHKSLCVYRPYDGLEDSLIPESGTNAFMSLGLNATGCNASPTKRNNLISPNKRRAMRSDDSIISADEADDSVFLRPDTMGAEEKMVKSWQEALGLQRELELGWMQDPIAKKNK